MISIFFFCLKLSQFLKTLDLYFTVQRFFCSFKKIYILFPTWLFWFDVLLFHSRFAILYLSHTDLVIHGAAVVFFVFLSYLHSNPVMFRTQPVDSARFVIWNQDFCQKCILVIVNFYSAGARSKKQSTSFKFFFFTPLLGLLSLESCRILFMKSVLRIYFFFSPSDQSLHSVCHLRK